MTMDSGSNPHEIPPKEELERLYREEEVGLVDISKIYDVSKGTVKTWLQIHDLYEHKRYRAGHSSELGEKLIDTDPDEVFGDNKGGEL